jgi:hypothetical protein
MELKKRGRVQEKVQQLLEQGFCIFEAVLSESEQSEIREVIDEYWRSHDGPSKEDGFGMGIHPLMPVLPQLGVHLAHPVIVDTLREVFQEEVRLVHAGARISSQASAPRLSWHHHYPWDASALPERTKPERVLAAVYVDGTLPSTGALVVLPRAFNEPIGEMRGDNMLAWPGERDVLMRPGSIALFDTALWHAAKAGNQPGLRRLFGAHYQGWSETRAHPEDNACNVPEIEPYKQVNSRLRGLVENDMPS